MFEGAMVRVIVHLVRVCVCVSVKRIMPYLSHFSSAVEGYYSWVVDIFANIFASGLLPLEAG